MRIVEVVLTPDRGRTRRRPAPRGVPDRGQTRERPAPRGASASRHPASDRGAQAFALAFFTKSVSVCSSSMPLVSGMRSSTYTNDSAAKSAYMP